MQENIVVSKVALGSNKVMNIILSVLGGIGTVMFIIPMLVGAYKGAAVIMVAIVLIAISVAVLYLGVNGIRRTNRLKKYIGIITYENQNSIENIAASTGKTIDFVKKDLEWFINKKIILNTHIDNSRNEVIVNINKKANNEEINESNFKVVECKCCGATNKIAEGNVGVCEFCESPLS